jgi:alkylated DNA repair dioxygenase AlkB
VSFGWRYDFNGGGLRKTQEIPDFLLPLRKEAAKFAGIAPASIEHVLVTEYGLGAAIGWHKDRPDFEEIIGVSLASSCTFRFRRKIATRWDRRSLPVEPRSVYLLSGQSRTEWEHSISDAEALRYSVTFRTLKSKRAKPTLSGR